ncbi:hypothetical protein ACIXN4_11250 [Bacteroides fragilis]
MTLNQLSKLSLPFFPKRSGWYFQQFLKLGISKLDDLSENYLVLDADTIFCKEFHYLIMDVLFLLKLKNIINLTLKII